MARPVIADIYIPIAASVHRFRPLSSATSMIMFHFFITSLHRHGSAPWRPLDFLVLLHHRDRRHVLRTTMPSGSICASGCAPAGGSVDFVWVRSGVSSFDQPPRSTDLPLAHRIVDSNNTVAVRHSARQPAEVAGLAAQIAAAAVVEDLTGVMLVDATFFRIFRIHAHHPVVIAVDLDAMVSMLSEELFPCRRPGCGTNIWSAA